MLHAERLGCMGDEAVVGVSRFRGRPDGPLVPDLKMDVPSCTAYSHLRGPGDFGFASSDSWWVWPKVGLFTRGNPWPTEEATTSTMLYKATFWALYPSLTFLSRVET
jgi:hypothetical protein